MTAQKVKKEIQKKANPKKAEIMQRFFKTGKGEYGEGDVFLGLTVPEQRMIAKTHRRMPLAEIQKLLHSKIHEHRLTALLMFVHAFEQGDNETKKRVYTMYIRSTNYINNWDLVDVTTPRIVGAYLVDKNRNVLYEFARSKDLWKRRIAMLATYTFIRKKDLKDTFALAKILLHDNHDLMHKAVGWMLREAGKVNKQQLVAFLEKYAATMPRTMLRYSIEKFSEKERKQFLNKGK